MNKLIYILLLFFYSTVSFGQSWSNIRNRSIVVADSVVLDSLSIVPSSLQVAVNNTVLPSSLFRVNYLRSTIYFTDTSYHYPAVLNISYRVFPINYSASYPLQTSVLLNSIDTIDNRSFQTYTHTGLSTSSENTLLANGNITRGVSIGNNQNLVVNSNLDLQLSGKLSDKVSIEAYLSDKNVPLQPDGYSQQIQEFDKIYIRVYDSTTYLQMGDVDINASNSYFMQFKRSIMGGDFGNTTKSTNKMRNTTQLSGAVAKGKYNRYSFNGLEAVQGPYRLTGANSETYITILAGTERIYIDGELLQRGENADYVINYNTAELTFTAKRMITKDARIIAEYEYSDRNYNRFLLYAQNQLQYKKGTYSVQYFSESDAKNQPLNADLSDTQREILANAGDNPQKAITSHFDTTTFSINKVLYKLVDTLVEGVNYDTVFVQSYNSDSAIYEVGFALVGEGNGNYVLSKTLANGKVYQWIAPINNLPQGNYEPVQMLIAPKKYQMLLGNAHYRFSENTMANVELALSNNDLNTFSAIDNSDNKGLALKTNASQAIILNRHKLLFKLNYETVSANFKEADRYRSAEFNRDWNLINVAMADENLVEVSTGLIQQKQTLVNYQFQYLNRAKIYSGFRNSAASNLSYKGFQFDAKASLLISQQQSYETQFYRHKINLHKNIGILNLGVNSDFEDNRQWVNKPDSLLAISAKNNQWETRLYLPDTLKRSLSLGYKNRRDYLPNANEFKASTQTHDINLNTKLVKSQVNQLEGTLTWRKLQILDANLASTTNNESNFLARIDHRLKFKKSWLTFFTFYETGTGMETYKEFSYIEVAAGQGIYVWVDYNNNGIPELNEFEVSPFPEEANYIRIYTPTNDYVKVFAVKLNETVNLNPQNVWRSAKGIKRVIARFSNSATLRTNQKHTNNDLSNRINPFAAEMTDSSLISNSYSFRNIFSFNRADPKFGADWIYQNRQQKSLLANGFDQSLAYTQQLNLRWNISQEFLLIDGISYEQLQFESEFYTSKNSKIEAIDNQVTLQWQPTSKFRIKGVYQFKQKENLWGNESVFIHIFGPEFKMSWPGKGMATVNVQAIKTNFTGITGTNVAYQMMDGYQHGENYKWTLNISRTLNQYLQLTVNYNGRKPAGSPTIHIGQLSLSAIF